MKRHRDAAEGASSWRDVHDATLPDDVAGDLVQISDANYPTEHGKIMDPASSSKQLHQHLHTFTDEANFTDIGTLPVHRGGVSLALPSGSTDGGAVTPCLKTAQCQDNFRRVRLQAKLHQRRDELTGRRGPGSDAFYIFGEPGGAFDPDKLAKEWKCASIELEAGAFHRAVDDAVWSRFHGNLLHRVMQR